MTSIEQSACNALCDYLQERMGSNVVVESRWSDKQPPTAPKAITILRAGSAQHAMAINAEPISVEELDPPAPARGLYRHQILEVTQPLQIDCWAATDIVRDELWATLTLALHAGDQRYESPVGPGLVLELDADDGWSGVAEYIFDNKSSSDHLASVAPSEQRATASGEARMTLYVDAELPRIADIKLQQGT